MEVLAPGKLFVMGEFAVLDGVDAIVAAVDHGVRCRVLAGQGLSTPDGDSRFVKAALSKVGAPSRYYEFSVWNPIATDHKVGLGGSAAAVVAAIGAARLAQGQTMSESDLDLAKLVHLEVQGSGSGRDVMASYFGGLSRFHGNHRTALAPLPFTIIHSGQSASTGPRVEAYKALGPQPAFLKESADLLKAFETDPVESLLAYGELVQGIALQAKFSYLTDAHSKIIDLSRQFGGGAKPSGAGGGDVAVALIPEEDARAAFVAACSLEGLVAVPVGMANGLHMGTQHA
jgi:phosphomevalonate kinase